MSASKILSNEFHKAIGGYLAKACGDGSAVTRPELAKFIRKTYGRGLDYTDLNMWLSSSVNLGLFDTTDAKFRTKRGVGGGIVMVGATAKPAPKAAPRKARKAKAAPTAQVQAASTPVAQPAVESVAQA
jgi:hypothetical protein